LLQKSDVVGSSVDLPISLGDDGHHIPSDLAPVYEDLQDMFPSNSVKRNLNEAFSEAATQKLSLSSKSFRIQAE
jgi:hypothetical protein